MRPKYTPAAALLAFVVPVGALAQEREQVLDLPLGSRVRVEIESGRRVVGTLTASEAGEMIVANDSGDQAFTIDPKTVARIYRSTSQGRKTGTGALIGGAIGLAAPVLVFGTIASRGNCDECTFGFGALVGGAYVGRFTIPIGALLGAVIGHELRSDRWEPVDGGGKPVGVRLALTPAPGRGLAAGFTVSWK